MYSINPRTGEAFGDPWPDTTPDQVNQLCTAATTAARTLRRTTAEQRATYLRAIATALDTRRDDLIETADAETALGQPRLQGELTRTIFQLRFLADATTAGHHLDATISPPTDSPMGPLPDLRRTAVPLGPVAVFAASNFPFAFSVPGGDTAAALAAGCPVIVKTHPSHPGLSTLVGTILSDALHQAGAPTGTFATINGLTAGTHLVKHPAITAVAFTGSQAGGRALFDLACARPDPIPFYGELGSLNPVIVTPAAATTRGPAIGADWIASVTLGSGQFCTKPGLLLIPATTADPTLTAITTAVTATPAATLLNESIHNRFTTGVNQLGTKATLVAQSTADTTQGFTARPAVLRGTVTSALKTPELLDEVFGPVGVILEYDNLDEVAALLDHLGGSLTVTIHGEDADPDGPHLVDLATTAAGRVIWNGYPTGVAVSPAMHHGGPWPASTSPRDTSVGAAAITRFVRPVAYQNVPESLLPPELRTQ